MTIEEAQQQIDNWIKNNQIRCCVGFKESFFNEHLKQLETKRQGYYYDRLQ